MSRIIIGCMNCFKLLQTTQSHWIENDYYIKVLCPNCKSESKIVKKLSKKMSKR